MVAFQAGACAEHRFTPVLSYGQETPITGLTLDHGGPGMRSGASPVPGRLYLLSFSTFGGGAASNVIKAFASL